jgi:hypothetical protein
MPFNLGNIINNMNDYLADPKEFADIIQLICIALIGSAFMLPLLDFSYYSISVALFQCFIVLAIVCTAKNIIYDYAVKHKEIGIPNMQQLAAIFVCISIPLMTFPLLNEKGIISESETTLSADGVDYIELLSLYGLFGMFVLTSLSTDNLWLYDKPCPHCQHSKNEEPAEPPAPKTSEPKPSEPIAEYDVQYTEQDKIEYADLE